MSHIPNTLLIAKIQDKETQEKHHSVLSTPFEPQPSQIQFKTQHFHTKEKVSGDDSAAYEVSLL